MGSRAKASAKRSSRRSNSNASRPRTLADYVDGLQANGQYVFRREDAMSLLGASDIAVQNAVRRLAAKGRVVTPRRGFTVVVPHEYRSAGTPPPSWFIDELMKFHERPYYVGVLSAAALHGAAHQQAHEFQVITDLPLRPAQAGRLRIRFFLKKRIEATPTMDLKTATGTMRVSTPEATAFDLVRYLSAAAGLGNVATLLAELAEKLDRRRLVHAAQAHVAVSVVQRTGFLLDRLGRTKLTDPLKAWLDEQRPTLALLHPGRRDGGDRDERWRVVVNEHVEVDE